ncbi:unnamed protein product [Thlaspi arvense]|uniref:Wall-associated receptor kinase galacturonan-binding domain-containing protein n=1 Tax=Thlaspi arvense TaxID=13288 RepID=A0AAU9SHE5_THLAR|nr:unnamed protein product [Thlaspi arvense]
MGSNNSFSLLIPFSLLLLLILDSAPLTASRSCSGECGGIEIPYPFGVGEGCYLEKAYEITCGNTSISGKVVPVLSILGKDVVNISLPRSIRIKNPITSRGCSSDGEDDFESLLNLTGTPFYVGSSNSMVASGCNNTALLTNVEPTVGGCKSSCGLTYHTPTKHFIATAACNEDYGYEYDAYCSERSSTLYEKSCSSGVGCCEISMPDLGHQIVGVRIDNTTTTGGCKVAFLTDEAYSLSNGSDPHRFHAEGYSTVKLTWFIDTANHSFVDSLGCYGMKEYMRLRASSSYESIYEKNCACDYYDNSSTYSCTCTQGYRGNPYVPGGCKG